MPATAEEEHMVFVSEALAPGFDVVFQCQNLIDRDRQVTQLLDVSAFVLCAELAPALGHG